MKKLFISIFTCVFALFALGTSTFAWFTMNTEVTATGMSVKATTDGSLVIMGTVGSGSEDTAYTNIGTNAVSVLKMKPCTSADAITWGQLAGGSQVKSAHSSVATWTGTNGAFDASNLSTIDLSVAENVKFVAQSVYSVKSIAETKDVYVKSITVAGANAALLPSIRVAVKAGDNAVKIFNPNDGALNDGKAGLYSSSWSLAAPEYISVNTLAAKLGSFAADTAENVVVYIWFEGQDTSCFTDNVNANEFTVDLVFTTTAPNA